MEKKSIVSWALLLILSLIWGSSFILIKRGLVELTSDEVGSLRIVAASFFFLPFAIRKFKSLEKIYYPRLLITGLLGSLFPSFLFALAQTHLESAITGVLNTMVPIFTILISGLFLKTKQDLKVYIGIAIGFVGSIFLIFAGETFSFDAINAYALVVILATICYASNLNYVNIKLIGLEPITVASISLLVVGTIAAIYLFGFTGFATKISDPAKWSSIFYICLLGLGGTAIANVIFYRLLQMTDPLFTSSVTYIIPIIAVVWGVVDGEQLYLMHYIGMMAVGLGVYVANTNRAAYKK